MTNISNIRAIDLFELDLTRYAAGIDPTATHIRDFRDQGEVLKEALLRIVVAPPADTVSMMRILVEHISLNTNQAFSQYVIHMVASATFDDRARQLIMAIVDMTRLVMEGQSVQYLDQWMRLLNHNMAIYFFLTNYGNSDLAIVEESYSGNIIVGDNGVSKSESDDDIATLFVGNKSYELYLTKNTVQRVVFSLDQTLHPESGADLTKPLIIQTEVLLCPQVGRFVLDKSILFYDDAVAQITALECAPNGYIAGRDTAIVLPNIYFSALLTVVSSDSGATFKVAGFQVLPPSITRLL